MINALIKVEKILDFYDFPQLFTARDNFDTLYLCLLYTDVPECRYTGIRISSKRINEFLTGKTDLREVMLFPESDGEYFEITMKNNEFYIDSKLTKPLTEDRLPEEGYSFCADEKENVVINIPVSDRGLLMDIVKKFGWACM